MVKELAWSQAHNGLASLQVTSSAISIANEIILNLGMREGNMIIQLKAKNLEIRQKNINTGKLYAARFNSKLNIVNGFD